ncbi:MAG: hypothetical protein OXU20_00925 [Myxococcales bacterium]|nr:hypothetical protein [Myxococcales bacterium]
MTKRPSDPPSEQPSRHTEHTGVDPKRALELLETYGADARRFPPGQRGAAEKLLKDQPDFAEAKRDAQALDSLLGLSQTRPASADLTRRVAEIPLRHPRQDRTWSIGGLLSPTGELWRALTAGLLAAALGVGSGLWTRSEPVDISHNSNPTYDRADAAWDEFALLAFADDLALVELEMADFADFADGASEPGDTR